MALSIWLLSVGFLSIKNHLLLSLDYLLGNDSWPHKLMSILYIFWKPYYIQIFSSNLDCLLVLVILILYTCFLKIISSTMYFLFLMIIFVSCLAKHSIRSCTSQAFSSVMQQEDQFIWNWRTGLESDAAVSKSPNLFELQFPYMKKIDLIKQKSTKSRLCARHCVRHQGIKKMSPCLHGTFNCDEKFLFITYGIKRDK